MQDCRIVFKNYIFLLEFKKYNLIIYRCRLRNLSKNKSYHSRDGINSQDEVEKDIIFCIKEHNELMK